MKAKLIIEGKEIEVDISEEEYKKIQPPEEKKTGYERVIKDDEFYYVSSRGHVEFASDDYRDIDADYYESANYYSSDVVAENNARADQLMRQLRRFAVEHRTNELDWGYTSIDKYYIFYNFEEKKLDIGVNTFLKDFGAIYFDSIKMAQIAVDAFYDELIWYFTEYKDSL